MMIDVYAIVEALARDLCRVNRDEVGGPHLMWPAKRDETVRVSEQESKILLCQTLERMGHSHSIETPTTERYRQTGETPISGRIDTTVYGSRSRADRKLNIELKAGNPPVESFRKDFEKLLCERVDGLWLHTLAAADRGTMPSIFGKAVQAFAAEDAAGHLNQATHTLHFAFVLLESSEVVVTAIELLGEAGSNSDIVATRFSGSDKKAWRRLNLLPPGAEWEAWGG